MAINADSLSRGTASPDAGRCFRGLAISPGLAVGRAVFARSPDAISLARPGDILVLSSLTIALAPALTRVVGVVAEHGGVLANAATLAREAAIPVVLLAAATSLLRPDEPIGLDGTNGIVRIG